MLVLTRQRDESIIIGSDIVVTVVDIRGEKVRLGFHGPASYRIFRAEVYANVIRDVRAGVKLPAPKGGAGMLVLARQRDEYVVVVAYSELAALADDAKYQPVVLADIMVTDIRGDQVKIGIDADRALSVHRKEVYDIVTRDTNAAAL